MLVASGRPPPVFLQHETTVFLHPKGKNSGPKHVYLRTQASLWIRWLSDLAAVHRTWTTIVCSSLHDADTVIRED